MFQSIATFLPCEQIPLKIATNTTSIFISHRLISTRFCDSILLMKDGRIIESGSHDELLELKGEYYNLFELQASKYREKGEID